MSKEAQSTSTILVRSEQHPDEQDQEVIIRWIKDQSNSAEEPLVGFMLRLGDHYVYGMVSRSVLRTGMINPMGACESPEEARHRTFKLLILALEHGVSVMGRAGIPAVIDLSNELEDEQQNPE